MVSVCYSVADVELWYRMSKRGFLEREKREGER